MNRQNYRDSSVFVPSTTFPEAEAKKQGHARPQANDPGGSIEIVQRGTAFGGVLDGDGGVDCSRQEKMRENKGGSWKHRMPENA